MGAEFVVEAAQHRPTAGHAAPATGRPECDLVLGAAAGEAPDTSLSNIERKGLLESHARLRVALQVEAAAVSSNPAVRTKTGAGPADPTTAPAPAGIKA